MRIFYTTVDHCCY